MAASRSAGPEKRRSRPPLGVRSTTSAVSSPPDRRPPTGRDQRLPQPFAALGQKEHLGISAAGVPPALEAGADDPRVVQDDGIIRGQVAREVAEPPVLYLAGVPVEHQHA